MKKQRVISIRWIVSGVAVVLTTLTVLTVGYFGERNTREALSRELETRLVVEARNLAMTSSRPLLSDFPELTLAPILSERSDQESRQAYTAVVDLEGIIRGHAVARRIGEVFELPADAARGGVAIELRPEERVLVTSELLVAAAPVKSPQGHTIGTAYVAFPRDYVHSVVAEARRALVVVVAILLAVAVVLVPMFMAHLLRPIGALREGLVRIGQGDLDSPVKLKDRTEFGLLADTINDMSRGLREAEQEKLEKQRLANEVELAREIQASLLPSGDFKQGGFVIDGAHRPAAEVGGDIWDVFPLADGRIGVAIADVSGKGLAGCLVTSMLSVLLRAFRDDDVSPTALLVRLERNLSLRAGTFITMFYGILDPADGTLTFASAAHNPVLIRRCSGKVEWLHTKGIPIGAVRGGAMAKTLSDDVVKFEAGDVLVQYTDGLSEAFDPSEEEQFGFDRIGAAVEAGIKDGPKGIIKSIADHLRRFTNDAPPFDDETLLVIRYEGAPVRPAEPDTAPDPLELLRIARQLGHHSVYPSDLDRLGDIPNWLNRCPRIADLDASSRIVLESALYEVAANIVEHGYGGRTDQTFEIGWVPSTLPPGRGPLGHFVIVDTGKAFEPSLNQAVDFQDSGVRRRGRGIGLEIVKGAMRRVSYHPGTPAGNVTVLAFQPSKSPSKELSSHG